MTSNDTVDSPGLSTCLSVAFLALEAVHTKRIPLCIELTERQKHHMQVMKVEHQTKEISDGFQLEFETLREKFSAQAKELSELKQNFKQCQHVAVAAVVLANNNKQYSQKNNIKFTNWQESEHENLRSDLCRILKATVNIDLDASDVLAIHRVLGGNRGGPRPVIAKFRDTDTKIKVIKNRSKEKIKKRFVMHDHLTQMNAQLIKTLNRDERIKIARYYNDKVFVEDHGGKRHRFDILDNVSNKVK